MHKMQTQKCNQSVVKFTVLISTCRYQNSTNTQ